MITNSTPSSFTLFQSMVFCHFDTSIPYTRLQLSNLGSCFNPSPQLAVVKVVADVSDVARDAFELYLAYNGSFSRSHSSSFNCCAVVSTYVTSFVPLCSAALACEGKAKNIPAANNKRANFFLILCLLFNLNFSSLCCI